MDAGQWNMNKNEDGAIDSELGQEITTLLTASEVDKAAIIKIFGHYNNSDIRLEEGVGSSYLMQYEFASSGNTLFYEKINIDVDRLFSKRNADPDNISDIQNLLFHENKHGSDRKEFGNNGFHQMSVSDIGIQVIEKRAIEAQINHPSWGKSSPQNRRNITKLLIPFGQVDL